MEKDLLKGIGIIHDVLKDIKGVGSHWVSDHKVD